MNEAERRTYVDVETGEAVDLVVVPRSARARTQGGFAMVMLSAFDRIADEGWPDGDYRVLIKLVGRLDWENYLHLDVTELAAEMGVSRESTSRAISRLVKRQVLHRGPRVGRSYTYRLDPGAAWRGQPAARHRVQDELARRGWSVVEGAPDGHEEDPLPGL